MKKTLLALLFITLQIASRGQTFGNEWINYSETHYKIQVPADGLYRIPYSTLNAAIPNLSAINVSSFVLYHNGQPVPIYVSAATTMGINDYIDFYGKKNIGDVDSILYKNGSYQPHPYYSLFNDTSIYYLTVRTNQGNPRFTPVVNNLSNPPAAETYFIYASRQILTSQNIQGAYYLAGTDETFKSLFDYGEGYGDATYFGDFAYPSTNQVNSVTYNIPTQAVYANGPQATFISSYFNNSPENHIVNIQVGNSIITTRASNTQLFNLNQVNMPISLSLLSSPTTPVTYTAPDQATSFQQNGVYMNEIDYPHTYNFGGQNNFYFKVAGDPVNKKYLVITNFNDNGQHPILYDITNGLVINSTVTPGSNPQFVLPPSATTRELYILSGDPSSFNTVLSLTPISFKNYPSTTYQSDYLIISNEALVQATNGDPYDEVTAYMHYRNQNYNMNSLYHAQIYDIDQLYDQFAYGVRKSPSAIRNFINWALNQYATGKWGLKPQYAFIIGKGLQYPSIRSNAAENAECLVPTFGMPASDNLLAATRTSDVPGLSVGRIAAVSAQEVHDYLAKMMAYEDSQSVANYPCNEQIPSKIWQKQILHFSGGTDFSEQTLFAYFLNSYAQTAEDTFWGANVTTYSKTSSAPISQTEAQVISAQINSGVSLLSFFGHSATGAFDFSINEPETYTNVGRYPVILSNGCFSGDIFETTPSYSERFVLEANKGSIAFVATSDLAVSTALNNFSGTMYDSLCVTDYYNTWGYCMKKTLTALFTNPSYTSDDFTQEAGYEIEMHGDPALRLNVYPKPDYAVAADGSSIFFTPSVITPGIDSFKVNVIVTNLGKAINKTIAVSLSRQVFDQNNHPLPLFSYKKYINAPYYIDTISFTLPTQISNINNGQPGLGYGQNQFYVYVDADNVVAEMAECNNGDSISINIQSDDVVPIYPYNFAIDSDKVVTVKASTTNTFAPYRKYDFQMDTTQFFNSPLLQSGSVNQVGGVLHWTPAMSYKDSVVYYWRVKIDTSSTWRYSSFEHISGLYGWNQSHFFQYLGDSYVNMKLDSTSRLFKFPSTVNNITVTTGLANAASPPGPVDFETMGWNYNNNNMYRYRMGGCGFTAGITFAVIDSITGLPWVSYNNDGDNYGDAYGNFQCSNQASFQYGFDFATTGLHGNGDFSGQGWTTLIKNFVNAIPCGDYVLIYSDNLVPYTSWDTTIVTALQGLGFPASLFQKGASPYTGPFIYFTQKCHSLTYPNTFAYQAGYSTGLTTSLNFNGTWYQGQFITPLIGPAVSWNRVQWRKPVSEQLTSYKDSIDIIGTNTAGVSTLLKSTTAFDNSIQNISARQYPYIQLRLRTENDSLRSPAQLSYWRVLYQKPAEAAINPAAYFSFKDSSMTLGGNFQIGIGLENVTKIRMDSMLMKYTLRDASFNNYSYSIRNSPLPGLDTLLINFTKPLTQNSFAGADQLTIEANPNGDQPEQFHFNNFATVNFKAAGDNINPVLDVTFDGQHIFSNDIISAKPDIAITLKDDNRYQPLNDTNDLNIYLLYPGSGVPVRINYDNQILTFYPADSVNASKGNNKAQAVFKPNLTQDGTYQLLVKDQDLSGNHSSNQDRYITTTNTNTYYDYKMQFQVINKSMITNVLNYPNPFTTATHFVFTLTGSQLPDFMKIQIMTIRGVVVKEVTMDELGPIHIGTNVTTYAWDGHDQFGSQLANGIYFYHVITRMNNENMDQMSMSYDNFFKKGFGKMVLLK
jgi:hypothetical protein